MKYLLFGVLAICAISTTSVSVQQSALPKPDFKGTWVTSGRGVAIAGVRIADDDGTGVKIYVSAACTPNPCEWPPAKFFVLRDASPRLVRLGEPAPPPSPERGYASWPGGKAVVLYFEGDQLVVDSYSVPEKQNERGLPLANYAVTKLTRG